MSEKFTPGPWSVEHSELNDNYWVESETSGTAGVCDLYSMDGRVLWSKENAKANAHLIAASPCLFEALEAFMSTYHVDATIPSNHFCDCWNLARAAMKKARGEAS